MSAITLHREAPSARDALAAAGTIPLADLTAAARAKRDAGYGRNLTYSPKVFIPLTQLCRDVCHYCTFAHAPRALPQPYLPIDDVVRIAEQGARQGCIEALFTLGDKPERRYPAARRALAELGYASTLDYLQAAAQAVLDRTGLLPHLNPGVLSAADYAQLRPVGASMGIMLETIAPRLSERGGPHFGSPDKHPRVRLAAIERAGVARVPLTSGLLIGIGETRRERVLALLALRASHRRHGHIQEVIVQNFRAKAGTRMASHPEPDTEELLWTVAMARLILDTEISVQVPPNLNPDALAPIIDAGINDWGGISPVTLDHVNPEAPWPGISSLAAVCESRGKQLLPRLTVYPRYIRAAETWLDKSLQRRVLAASDSDYLARGDAWTAGSGREPRKDRPARSSGAAVDPGLKQLVARATAGQRLPAPEITRLFQARGSDYAYLAGAADELRREVNGETVSYVINRNINYTNICTYHCSFCAFSKGKVAEDLRDKPYVLELDEIGQRAAEAQRRGATEVCMQGGIHPRYTGQTYLDIVAAVVDAAPGIHIHAFSPLEVHQGAATSGLDLADYLRQLREQGLRSLPGTAAEILVDEVRAVLCPDKIGADRWLEVMRAAHAAGLHSTATIMFGHVDTPRDWAEHLLKIRDLQEESLALGAGCFTELVPLPFVHEYSPLCRRRGARRGPTYREAILMHAVARLALHPVISNIQASWVKMGRTGVLDCLDAGVNDLGGTLMNESITRAAGARHGQELTAQEMHALIVAHGRVPRQRTTLYGDADDAACGVAANGPGSWSGVGHGVPHPASVGEPPRAPAEIDTAGAYLRPAPETAATDGR